MKKLLLLFMLLPLIGFTQNASELLVRWEGTRINWSSPSTQPMYYDAGASGSLTSHGDFTAANIDGAGISFNSGEQYTGFRGTGWPTGNSANSGKYYQLTITAETGKEIELKNFKFDYKGKAKRYTVTYQKSSSGVPSNSSMLNGTALATNVNIASTANNSQQTVNLSFPSNYTLLEGETLYIRVYAHKVNNNDNRWFLVTNNYQNNIANSNSVGPAIYGTVSTSSGDSGSGSGVSEPAITGALCGTYYVGTDGDFTTITDAVDYLNDYGVNCPVTFLLKDVLYDNESGETFPITINNFTGSSATNTVTFKPNTGVNVKVEATNINHYTGVSSVFKLNGADNIIFDGSNEVEGSTRNLTIKNKSNISYNNRSVLSITSNGSNGATNNTVKYCDIRQEYKNSGSNLCIGVFSGSNDSYTFNTATADNANLTVLGNNFMNVKQGVYVEGNASTRTTNVVIHQNDLGSENNTETIIQPAYLSNVNGFEYTENYIYNLYRDTNAGSLKSSGIYIENNTSNGSIQRNVMKDLTKVTTDAINFAGIVLASTNTNANILVANNSILNVAGNDNGGLTGNGYGISIINGGGYKIYNNTVVLNTPQSNIDNSSKGFSSALYITNSSNIDVRNNIFVNNQNSTITRRCSILINGNTSMLSNLDYNNLFSADKIGYIGTNATWSNNPDYQTTLSGWQSFTGKDANSINELPVFISDNDLHLASNDNDVFNNLGTPLADVTKDMDGQLRNTTAPDMGADEFGAIQMPTAGAGEGIYCDTSVTWNGTAWIGGEPTATTDVIFAGDYTQDGYALYACSIFVIDGANVIFENNANAIVTHSVNVEEGSTLTFESSSNLVQIENTKNEGIVTVKRNSSMIKRLDYTIWSSPVTGTQTLLDFSPQTLTNRFYKFNTASNIYNAIADPASTVFETAKGYLIRVANNHSATEPSVYEGAFVGTPNNGTIRRTMEYTNGDQSYNIVGNPYASPINVNKFIDANIDNIDGTIWVWRKTNDPTKTTYCTINKMGFVANNAPGGGGENGNDGNELIGDPFDTVEGGVLNTGQGFFVRALNDNELVFSNNMRETVNYNNFFRSENTAEQQDTTNQTNRYWLNVVTEDETVFTQMLVAHSALATNDYDKGYDGKAFLDGDVSLYTIIDAATEEEESLKLSIQSRATFTATDVIKVGFNTEIAGTFSFTIDHMDGLFSEGQAIYLVDKFTNTTYNLANGNYTFDSEIGIFENRFEVIYSIETLGTETPQFTKDDVVVYQNNKELSINAPQNIESVVIYDLLGKVLYQNAKVDNTEFTTTVNTQQQVAIVMITLENNQVVSKKIMIN